MKLQTGAEPSETDVVSIPCLASAASILHLQWQASSALLCNTELNAPIAVGTKDVPCLALRD